MKRIETHCNNCGAPVTTEICPYCNATTGINSKVANMEYPVIDCKEANVGFFNVVFPMIFAIAFGFAGIMVTSMLYFISKAGAGKQFNFGIIFLVIGLITFIIAIIPLIRKFLIELNGKTIEATVYGYMDDNVLINGIPAQIVKLLVDTNDGKKFILYQLGDTKQPFKVNSKINLKVYKDIFEIENKKQYYF